MNGSGDFSIGFGWNKEGVCGCGGGSGYVAAAAAAAAADDDDDDDDVPPAPASYPPLLLELFIGAAFVKLGVAIFPVYILAKEEELIFPVPVWEEILDFARMFEPPFPVSRYALEFKLTPPPLFSPCAAALEPPSTSAELALDAKNRDGGGVSGRSRRRRGLYCT